MRPVELCWNITSYISTIVQLIATGVCFGVFVLPYMRGIDKAIKAGGVYGVVMTVLYIIPPQIDNILAYFIGTTVAFAVMYVEDRQNINQKIFLSVTFFMLRWLSASMAGIIDRFLDIILFNSEIAAMAWLHYGLYVIARIVDILFCSLLLLLSIYAVNRAYEYKNRYMGRKELLMLVVPSLLGIVGYMVFHFYQVTSEMTGFYDVLCFIYYLVSIVAILVVIVIFQNWKSLQEEQSGQELLENQINNIKMHIKEVEKLYGDLRAMRHDMGNHIQMIEHLMSSDNSSEAFAYLGRLKNEWQELAPEIRTGNPVTDMIFLEKGKEAQMRGIRFECDFRYPENTKLDVFDVCIILYNALDNCLESVNGEKPYVKVHAFRNNSIFMLIISNSFKGRLRIDPAEGIPYTVKKNGEHGIGLKNMRRVAKKYMGDLSFEQNGDEVTVGIMLQIV
ncbi:MAG: GHKL domain-containing protein [Lachnospiraceae bacterium]|nr:GHKL domain-containing protein [Lachnospiraceae bacterium]